jgi:hypothetical protein
MHPDPHPLPCLCGGAHRYSERVITDLVEAIKVRPAHPGVMKRWLPITVREYRCRDAPTPGPGINPPRPEGCGRGARIITDGKGAVIVWITDLARQLGLAR